MTAGPVRVGGRETQSVPPRDWTDSRTRVAVGLFLSGLGRTIQGLGALMLSDGLSAPWRLLREAVRGRDEGSVALAAFVLLPLYCLFGAAWLAAGSRLNHLGIRVRQRTAQEVLRGGEEFVLFLRSFQLDRQREAPSAVPSTERNVLLRSLENLPGRLWGVAARRPIEARMVDAFRKYCQVIAVGRPGERLPAMGAARLYIEHEDWRQRVRELIQQARCVVLAAGSSPGLLWELRALLQLESLARTAVWIPQDQIRRTHFDQEWQEFRTAAIHAADLPLDALPNRFATEVTLLFAKDGGRWTVKVIRPGAEPQAGAHRRPSGRLTVQSRPWFSRKRQERDWMAKAVLDWASSPAAGGTGRRAARDPNRASEPGTWRDGIRPHQATDGGS